MKHAILAGSFDPFTNGHLWTLERGLELFDHVTIAVGVNPEKRPLLNGEQRQELIRRVTLQHQRVSVEQFSGEFLAHYAARTGANVILRGIRSTDDLAYEQRMAYLTIQIAPQVTTVYVLAPASLAHVSSSLVKGIIGLAGWKAVVGAMVPPETLSLLVETYHDTH